MLPRELIEAFRAAPDIAAFLKPLDIGDVRKLTRAYRSSHGLQESDGRKMYAKHTLVASLVEAEEDRRERAGLTRTVGDSTT
jgi:hypothetical protein